MSSPLSMNNKPLLLYLNTRALPLERDAEIKAAEETGIDIFMAAPSLLPYEGYSFAHFLEAPVTRHAEAREIIIEHLQSTGIQVQGVVAWSEHQVELIAQLGTDLGLLSSTPDAVSNVRNKANTRRILDRIGSVNPKYAIIRDEESFKAGLEKVGVPCLLKPAGASGGRGIFKINSCEKALESFYQFREYCSPDRDEVYSYFNQEFLLEEQLKGSEHSVGGIVVDGEVIVLAITDKQIDFTVPIQYQNITPSLLPQETQNEVINIVRSAVKLAGINWCGFHMDFMVTSQGVKTLEMGGRLGGECINSHLIPLSTPTVNPYHAILQVVQGINPFSKTDYTGDATHRAGLRILLPPTTGRVRRIEGLDKVKQHPNTREFLQLRKPGDEVVLPSVKFYGYEIGFVIAQCGLEENIQAILDEIASLVTVEMEP